MQLTIKITALLATVVLATACSKRLDEPVQGPPGTANNISTSVAGIRLVNFCQNGYLTPEDQGGAAFDLSINDRKLTTFSSAYNWPTNWFATGKFTIGKLFSIPDSLLDAKGDALLKLYLIYKKLQWPQDYDPSLGYLDSIAMKMSMAVHNNPDHPQDVLFSDLISEATPGRFNSQGQVLITERSQVPPSRPDYFKIRLINLAAMGKPGPLDQLTLLYADGKNVNTKTTAVAGRQVSDYIELPYGTYQFKIKDQAGRLLSEATMDEQYPMDTSGRISGTFLQYNPPHTYNPGGVYTIVGCWPRMTPNSIEGGVRVTSTIPGFNILTDVAPSAAPNFIHIQGIHALPGVPDVLFTVDGRPLDSLLQYGQGSAYSAFSIGPHKVQLLDGTGKELASRMLGNTMPLNNISVWAYAVNDKPQLLVTYNDMANSLIDGLDATLNRATTYSWGCRFLNLTETVPYASLVDSAATGVTTVNTQWRYVGIGAIPAAAFSLFGFNYPPSAASLSAYNTPPGEWPGTPLQVTVRRPMLANPLLYPANKMPAAEAGTYTIALIGSGTAGSPLQLITIKHNQ